MPAMGGGRGGGLMVPRGGMGRRSSCYPGGPGGGGIPPSVHKAGRRASSRSEAGIGFFPGLLGGGKNQVIWHLFYARIVVLIVQQYAIYRVIPLQIKLQYIWCFMRNYSNKSYIKTFHITNYV